MVRCGVSVTNKVTEGNMGEKKGSKPLLVCNIFGLVRVEINLKCIHLSTMARYVL